MSYQKVKKAGSLARKLVAGACMIGFGLNPVLPAALYALTVSDSQVTSTHQDFPRGREMNPSIAFNPTNPQMGLVAYTETKDGGPTRVAGLGITKDGGLSYTNRKMDNLWAATGTSLISYLGSGDVDGPHLAFNANGRAYYLSSGVPQSAPTQQIPMISYSDNNGKTWSQPVALAEPAELTQYHACQMSIDPRNNDVLVACRKDMAVAMEPRPLFQLSQMVLFTMPASPASGNIAANVISNTPYFGDGQGTSNLDNGEVLFYPSPPVVGADAENPGHKAIYVAFGFRAAGFQVYLYKKAEASGGTRFVANVPCLNRVTPFGSHAQPSIPRVLVDANGIVHCISGTCLPFTYQLLDIMSEPNGHFLSYDPFANDYVEYPVAPGLQPKNWKPVLPSLDSPNGENPSSEASFASWGRDAIWNGWPAKHGYTLNRSVDSKNLKLAYKAVSPVSGNQQVLSLWLREQRNNFLTGAVAFPLFNFVAVPYQQAAVLAAVAQAQLGLSNEDAEALEANLASQLRYAFDQQAFETAIQTACNNAFANNPELATACINTLANQGAPILFQFGTQDLVALCASVGVQDPTACANAISSALNRTLSRLIGLDQIPADVQNDLAAAGITVSEVSQVVAGIFSIAGMFNSIGVGAGIDALLIQSCKNVFSNDPAKQQACFTILFGALPHLFSTAPAGSPASDAYNLSRGVASALDTIRDDLIADLGLKPVEAEYAARAIWIGLLNGLTVAQACANLGLSGDALTACSNITSNAINSTFSNFAIPMTPGDNIGLLVYQILQNYGNLPSTFSDELSELMANLIDQMTLGSGTEAYNTIAVGYPEGVDLVADIYATTCSFDGNGGLNCPEATKISGPSRIDGTMASWGVKAGETNIGARTPGTDPQPQVLMANYGTEMGVATSGTATCAAYADTRNATNCPAVEKLQYVFEQCQSFYYLNKVEGEPFDITYSWADCQSAFQTMGLEPFDLGDLINPEDPVGTLNGASVNDVCDSGFDNSDIYVSCIR